METPNAAPMTINVDSRECDLIRILGIDCVSSHLNVGDILIGKVLIERKTVTDLIASIQDGRWHDQLARMKQFVDFGEDSQSIVVVEGLYSKEYGNSFPRRNVFSALYGAFLRDKIPFVATNDISETADFCRHIKSLLNSNKSPSFQSGLPRLRARKSIFENPVEIAKAQLQVIPGISSRISAFLLQDFRTLFQFLTHWSSKEQYELADMKIGDRKIGKSIASKIFESLIRPN